MSAAGDSVAALLPDELRSAFLNSVAGFGALSAGGGGGDLETFCIHVLTQASGAPVQIQLPNDGHVVGCQFSTNAMNILAETPRSSLGANGEVVGNGGGIIAATLSSTNPMRMFHKVTAINPIYFYSAGFPGAGCSIWVTREGST